jgi:hypothetical protein
MRNHTNNREQNINPGPIGQDETFTTEFYGVLIVKEGKHFFLVNQRNANEEYHGQRKPTEEEIEVFAAA